jgi:hypothetical protein
MTTPTSGPTAAHSESHWPALSRWRRAPTTGTLLDHGRGGSRTARPVLRPRSPNEVYMVARSGPQLLAGPLVHQGRAGPVSGRAYSPFASFPGSWPGRSSAHRPRCSRHSERVSSESGSGGSCTEAWLEGAFSVTLSPDVRSVCVGASASSNRFPVRSGTLPARRRGSSR